jgi:hypothetical protein
MSKGATKPKTPSRAVRGGDKQWAILAFMIGNPELGSSIDRDLLELARADASDLVDIVVAVQRTARSATEWLEIASQPDGSRKKQRTAKQPSRRTANLLERLEQFLAFVAREYPAEHYLLILWGHASGLEFGLFEPGSDDDRLSLESLAKSLGNFRTARDRDSNLEILGLCGCALSKAEFVLELREQVDFLVSSQVGISTLMTWPFDEIAQLVVKSPSVVPETLASQIVQCFEEFYEPPPVGLTALDLTKGERLRTEVDGLAVAILKAFAAPADTGVVNKMSVLKAFKNALAAYPYELEPLVDFFDFARKLVDEEFLEQSVRERARRLVDRGSRSYVVYNARSGPKLGALHGLSILAPDLDDPDLEKIIDACSKSKAWLWQNTRWVEMVSEVHKFALSNPEFV